MPKVNIETWERISNRFSHTQTINERVRQQHGIQKESIRGREVKSGSIRVKRGNARDKRTITGPI